MNAGMIDLRDGDEALGLQIVQRFERGVGRDHQPVSRLTDAERDLSVAVRARGLSTRASARGKAPLVNPPLSHLDKTGPALELGQIRQR